MSGLVGLNGGEVSFPALWSVPSARLVPEVAPDGPGSEQASPSHATSAGCRAAPSHVIERRPQSVRAPSNGNRNRRMMRDAIAAGVAPSANGQARCERKGIRGVSSGRTSTMFALVLLLVVSTGWGSALSLARFAVTAGVPPMGYVLWMSVAAAVLCLGLSRARGGWP